MLLKLFNQTVNFKELQRLQEKTVITHQNIFCQMFEKSVSIKIPPAKILYYTVINWNQLQRWLHNDLLIWLLNTAEHKIANIQ